MEIKREELFDLGIKKGLFKDYWLIILIYRSIIIIGIVFVYVITGLKAIGLGFIIVIVNLDFRKKATGRWLFFIVVKLYNLEIISIK